MGRSRRNPCRPLGPCTGSEANRSDLGFDCLLPEAGGRRDHRRLAWNVVAEDGSVGIRIPMADLCRQLTFKLGRPIVSTSANISGEPTPVRFTDIPEEIKAACDFVFPPKSDTQSTGKASQIIKIGLRGEVEIIRK